MLRKRLIKLACITVLAMGISSQASADPIPAVSVTPTFVGDDLFGEIWQFVFDVTYTDTCEITVAGCNAEDNGVWGIDVFLDVLSIVSFDEPLGWLGFEFGFGVSYASDAFFGDVPPTSFLLTIVANIGDIPIGSIGDSELMFTWGPFGDSTSVFAGVPPGTNNGGNGDVDVPEPGTLGLLGLGLLGLGIARRRRQMT